MSVYVYSVGRSHNKMEFRPMIRNSISIVTIMVVIIDMRSVTPKQIFGFSFGTLATFAFFLYSISLIGMSHIMRHYCEMMLIGQRSENVFHLIEKYMMRVWVHAAFLCYVKNIFTGSYDVREKRTIGISVPCITCPWPYLIYS